MATQSATAAFSACRRERERGVWNLIRPLERVFSLFILLLLAPWLALVAIAIAALSGRSPLVAHLRVGQFGAPLWTLKFRTMWPRRNPAGGRGLIENIIDERGPSDKSSADPRITSKFARFCRRFSVDELPQLIHVVRGEMSLVAPRPLTVAELQKYYGSDASEILTLKPGVTGLWQVSGRSQLTYEQRREMDLFLVRHRSLRLYFTILLRTIPAVLTGKDGW
jgi:lipopolysaccharide/colanic/teichoic acid biosynthesis glycosyltransferase